MNGVEFVTAAAVGVDAWEHAYYLDSEIARRCWTGATGVFVGEKMPA